MKPFRIGLPAMVALLVGLVLVVQLVYFSSSNRFLANTDMENVRWWFQLGQVMDVNGFFKTWTPYPPVFPMVYYTFIHQMGRLSFEDVRTMWQLMNVICLATSGYLVYLILMRTKRSATVAALGAGFFVFTLVASLRSTFQLSFLNDQFEYFPMVILFAGILLLLDRRWFWVGIVAGVGLLTKIYPGVLLLVVLAVIRDWESVKRLAAGFLIALAVILLPYAVKGTTTLTSMVAFTLSRDGWESAYTYPDHKFAPIPKPDTFASPFTDESHLQLRYRLLLPLFVLLAMVATAIARYRRMSLEAAPHLTLGLVALFLFLSKGFSSYFVLWVIPLTFVAYSFEIATIWSLALLLASNLVFTESYFTAVFLRQALVGGLVIDQFWRIFWRPARLWLTHQP